MKVIDEQKIRAVVREPEALTAAEIAFRAMAEDRAQIPAPMGLFIPEVSGEVHIKSAYLRGAPVFAVKIASGFYQNAAKGLPSGAGLIIVFDAQTGFPQALLDDNGYLTDLRTAAAGALAARLLTVDPLGKVAVLGSGIQARFQLRALAQVRRWERSAAWSRDRERLERYCREMQTEFERPCYPAPTPEAALRGADLVITVTPSRAPLFDASSLPNHATVIAVGSDGADKQELPAEALARADKIVVDRLSQCLALGEVHHAVEDGIIDTAAVHAELGEVLIGKKAGREGTELIVCDLTGVGAQDAAIAEVAWRKLI